MIWWMCAVALAGMLWVAMMARTRSARWLVGAGDSDKSSDATVLALGVEGGESPCRVVSASRFKIHLVSSRPVRMGTQVAVQRGNECFVGAVRHVAASDDGYVLDLGVFASNYREPRRPLSAWGFEVAHALLRAVSRLLSTRFRH